MVLPYWGKVWPQIGLATHNGEHARDRGQERERSRVNGIRPLDNGTT